MHGELSTKPTAGGYPRGKLQGGKFLTRLPMAPAGVNGAGGTFRDVCVVSPAPTPLQEEEEGLGRGVTLSQRGDQSL